MTVKTDDDFISENSERGVDRMEGRVLEAGLPLRGSDRKGAKTRQGEEIFKERG